MMRGSVKTALATWPSASSIRKTSVIARLLKTFFT